MKIEINVSYQTLEALNLLDRLYFFGKYIGKNIMNEDEERKEYMMRDAIIDLRKQIDEQIPKLIKG